MHLKSTMVLAKEPLGTYFLMYCQFLSDEREVRNLVQWLEDQKIRRYKIEDRGPLKTEGPEWYTNFDKYCKDLASPVLDGSMPEKLEWLIGYAVSLEYSDDGEFYCIV